MPVEFEPTNNNNPNTSSTSASGDAATSVSSGQPPAPPPPPPPPVAAAVKKKRNLPGMPDPDAEVIALSPKTLMATNRFVCEICQKGFQRDQNLQLHRRGHNLPWKLRQRTGKEVRKRVYVCPEAGCVHHDPSRALGDLTGIKKHFCRKHGEKKWKCDKCSKKYAVQSDWKAHAKTCGTREYRCDCGTLFSRRDSFITHRAFCDALAEESAKTRTVDDLKEEEGSKAEETEMKAKTKTKTVEELPIQSVSLPPPPPPPAPESEETENSSEMLQYLPPVPLTTTSSPSTTTTTTTPTTSTGNSTSLFASLFSSSSTASPPPPPAPQTAFTDLISSMNRPDTISLCLASGPNSSLFSPTPPAPPPQFSAPPPSPHMSATALLQKAAQMGAAASTSSFLRGLGLSTSSDPSSSGDAGLGLGLPYDNVSGFNPGLMMGGSSSLFGPKPTTLDLLGLGIGPALMTSLGGGMDVGPAGSAGPAWDGPDLKPSSSTIL